MESNQTQNPPVTSAPVNMPTSPSAKSSYLARLYKGRIGRGFFVEGLFVLGGLYLLYTTAIGTPLILLKANSTPIILIVDAIGFVLVAFFSIPLQARRLRDLNKPWWYLLLFSLIPMISTLLKIKVLTGLFNLLSFGFLIYLIFWTGTKGNNKYGPPPATLTMKQTFKSIFGLK